MKYFSCSVCCEMHFGHNQRCKYFWFHHLELLAHFICVDIKTRHSRLGYDIFYPSKAFGTNLVDTCTSNVHLFLILCPLILSIALQPSVLF